MQQRGSRQGAGDTKSRKHSSMIYAATRCIRWWTTSPRDTTVASKSHSHSHLRQLQWHRYSTHPAGSRISSETLSNLPAIPPTSNRKANPSSHKSGTSSGIQCGGKPQLVSRVRKNEGSVMGIKIMISRRSS